MVGLFIHIVIIFAVIFFAALLFAFLRIDYLLIGFITWFLVLSPPLSLMDHLGYQFCSLLGHVEVHMVFKILIILTPIAIWVFLNYLNGVAGTIIRVISAAIVALSIAGLAYSGLFGETVSGDWIWTISIGIVAFLIIFGIRQGKVNIGVQKQQVAQLSYDTRSDVE